MAFGHNLLLAGFDVAFTALDEEPAASVPASPV